MQVVKFSKSDWFKKSHGNFNKTYLFCSPLVQ